MVHSFLLQGKATPPYHDTQVAVVGGGMAGLAAASALSEAGLQVVLLEASDYFGKYISQFLTYWIAQEGL